ncbi:MAG: hypothetical protein KAU03_03855, partial [Candidatus Altiarchaeales archaeon]|nr:hypothetical protein [Candidatus Altiarchaeales archaeon]
MINGLRLQQIAMELLGEPLDAATIPLAIIKVKEVPVNGKPVPVGDFLSEKKYWENTSYDYREMREHMEGIILRRLKKRGVSPGILDKWRNDLSKMSNRGVVEEFLEDPLLGDPIAQLISYAPSEIRVTNLEEGNLDTTGMDILELKDSMLREVHEAHGEVFDGEESTKERVVKKAAQRNGKILGLALGVGVDFSESTEDRNHIVGSVVTDFDDLKVPMSDTDKLFASETEIMNNQQKILKNLLHSMSMLSKFLGTESYDYMDEFISAAAQTYAKIKKRVLENPEQRLFTQEYIKEYNSYLSQLEGHKLENQDIFDRIFSYEEEPSPTPIKTDEKTEKTAIKEPPSTAPTGETGGMYVGAPIGPDKIYEAGRKIREILGGKPSRKIRFAVIGLDELSGDFLKSEAEKLGIYVQIIDYTEINDELLEELKGYVVYDRTIRDEFIKYGG